jgi:hypothetical protein
MNAPMAFIDELHEEEAQSFKKVVEEAAKAPPPCKNKKNMKGKDEVGLKRVLAQERTPSLVTLSNVDIITNFI